MRTYSGRDEPRDKTRLSSGEKDGENAKQDKTVYRNNQKGDMVSARSQKKRRKRRAS
jgi:hypothetical protein